MTDIKYTLGNGTERNRTNPETFQIPSEKVKNAVGPGALVKLMFEPTSDTGVGGERMWVLVIDAEDGEFLGLLDNDPIFIDDLEYRDLVEFTSDHIIDVTIPNELLELAAALAEEA